MKTVLNLCVLNLPENPLQRCLRKAKGNQRLLQLFISTKCLRRESSDQSVAEFWASCVWEGNDERLVQLDVDGWYCRMILLSVDTWSRVTFVGSKAESSYFCRIKAKPSWKAISHLVHNLLTVSCILCIIIILNRKQQQQSLSWSWWTNPPGQNQLLLAL